MSRSFGGDVVDDAPVDAISPPVIDLEPGDHPSSVDLPHPDGPTRMTNSPSSTLIETP